MYQAAHLVRASFGHSCAPSISWLLMQSLLLHSASHGKAVCTFLSFIHPPQDSNFAAACRRALHCCAGSAVRLSCHLQEPVLCAAAHLPLCSK